MSLSTLAAGVMANLFLAGGAPATVTPDHMSAFPLNAVVRSVEDELYALLDQVDQAIEAEDTEQAIQVLEKIVALPGFETWDSEVRYKILFKLAGQYASENRFSEAYQIFLKAEALPQAQSDPFFWIQFSLAAMSEDEAKAIEALMTHLSIYSGESLLNDDFIGLYAPLALGLPDGMQRQKQLMEAIRASGYVSDNVSADPNAIWFDLFKVYVHEGDEARAWALMPFADSQSVLRMRIEHAYAPYLKALPKEGDYSYALEQDLLLKRKAYAEAPDDPDALIDLSYELIRIGRLEEAETLLTGAIERREAVQTEQADDYIPWFYGLRALTHNLSGDLVAAENDYRHAMQVNSDANNPFYVIGLASFYSEHGRNDEAAELIATLETADMEIIDQVWVASIVACMPLKQGRDEAFEAARATLAAHAWEDIFISAYGLLCAGDEAVLAGLIIEGLDNPLTREKALLYVQTYKPFPHASHKVVKIFERQKGVLARPDVRAAIERYGVIETLPVYWY
ncbi:MAG: hypothetical protein QM645_00825 [Asticcacaulis sp.]